MERLGNVRVKQPNLVYVVGLPSTANVRSLFGPYGRIVKVVKNFRSGSNGEAYITYDSSAQAGAAIKALNGRILENGRALRCVRGTTKYCTYFLRNQECPNPSCLYLHQLGPDEDEDPPVRLPTTRTQPPPPRPGSIHTFTLPSQEVLPPPSAVSPQDPANGLPSIRRFQSQPSRTQPRPRPVRYDSSSKVTTQRSAASLFASSPPAPPLHVQPPSLRHAQSTPTIQTSVPTLPTARPATRPISTPQPRASATPSAPPGLHKTTVKGPSYSSPSPVASAASLPPGLSQPPVPPPPYPKPAPAFDPHITIQQQQQASSPTSTLLQGSLHDLAPKSSSFGAHQYVSAANNKPAGGPQESPDSQEQASGPELSGRLLSTTLRSFANPSSYWNSNHTTSTGALSAPSAPQSDLNSCADRENTGSSSRSSVSLDQFFEQLTSNTNTKAASPTSTRSTTNHKPLANATSAASSTNFEGNWKTLSSLFFQAEPSRTQSRYAFARG